MLSRISKSVQKHPTAALALVGGGTAAGIVAAEDIKRGMRGLSPQYLAARRAGAPVPKVQSRYGYTTLTTEPDPQYDHRLRQWSGG